MFSKEQVIEFATQWYLKEWPDYFEGQTATAKFKSAEDYATLIYDEYEANNSKPIELSNSVEIEEFFRDNDWDYAGTRA
jgi:hypothetical protein